MVVAHTARTARTTPRPNSVAVTVGTIKVSPPPAGAQPALDCTPAAGQAQGTDARDRVEGYHLEPRPAPTRSALSDFYDEVCEAIAHADAFKAKESGKGTHDERGADARAGDAENDGATLDDPGDERVHSQGRADNGAESSPQSAEANTPLAGNDKIPRLADSESDDAELYPASDSLEDIDDSGARTETESDLEMEAHHGEADDAASVGATASGASASRYVNKTIGTRRRPGAAPSTSQSLRRVQVVMPACKNKNKKTERKKRAKAIRKERAAAADLELTTLLDQERVALENSGNGGGGGPDGGSGQEGGYGQGGGQEKRC